MLLGAFRPQTTTEDKKVTNSELTRISYFTALTVATYVVLSEITEHSPIYPWMKLVHRKRQSNPSCG
jgi:hypothetical protein